MKTAKIVILWIIVYAVIAAGIVAVILWQYSLHAGVPFEASYEMYLIPAGEEMPSGEKVTLSLSEGRLCKNIFTGRITAYSGKAEMGEYAAKSNVSVSFGEVVNHRQTGGVWIEDDPYCSPLIPMMHKDKDGTILLLYRQEEEGVHLFCTANLSRSELNRIFFGKND